MAMDDSAVGEQRVTPDLIRSKKGRQRITFVTAYDDPTAKLADEAGIDMVLVGDTLAEVVLGHETTLPVTFEAMLHHTCAARRAIKRALLVADLPHDPKRMELAVRRMIERRVDGVAVMTFGMEEGLMENLRFRAKDPGECVSRSRRFHASHQSRSRRWNR